MLRGLTPLPAWHRWRGGRAHVHLTRTASAAHTARSAVWLRAPTRGGLATARVRRRALLPRGRRACQWCSGCWHAPRGRGWRRASHGAGARGGVSRAQVVNLLLRLLCTAVVGHWWCWHAGLPTEGTCATQGAAPNGRHARCSDYWHVPRQVRLAQGFTRDGRAGVGCRAHRWLIINCEAMQHHVTSPLCTLGNLKPGGGLPCIVGRVWACGRGTVKGKGNTMSTMTRSACRDCTHNARRAALCWYTCTHTAVTQVGRR